MADPVSFELYHDPNLCNFGQCSGVLSSISTLLKWISVVVAMLLCDVAVTQDVR